jgi:hypothetical protein
LSDAAGSDNERVHAADADLFYLIYQVEIRYPRVFDHNPLVSKLSLARRVRRDYGNCVDVADAEIGKPSLALSPKEP